MRRPRILATAALALLLAGCGYFNTMYNAQRRFRDAQSAAARGDDAAARRAYGEVIEKAAKSYRSRPEGRWADDALFLIGRAHFSLADYDAAHAAMSHLLARSPDATLRADAFAVRGAAELALGSPLRAVASLDSAAALAPSAALRGFVHLWRARAAFSIGDTLLAWQQLAAASADDGAALDDARDLSARLQLAGLEEPAQLGAVRDALLPAVAHNGARHLLRLLATLDVLLERAADPLQRIALFAAAEVARDSLRAPVLARRLFLDYATAAADEPWTGKALLAALQLSPTGARADSIRKRMTRHPHDVYLRAVAGATDEAAFTLAEERLARELIAVRHDAAQLAERALLALDTLRRRSP